MDHVLNGAPDWKRCAEDLKADYVFWGRQEKEKFPGSAIPWANEPVKAKGEDWILYDLCENGKLQK